MKTTTEVRVRGEVYKPTDAKAAGSAAPRHDSRDSSGCRFLFGNAFASSRFGSRTLRFVKCTVISLMVVCYGLSGPVYADWHQFQLAPPNSASGSTPIKVVSRIPNS